MDNCDEETECLRRVVCVCICVYACLHVDFLLFFPPMQIFVNVYFYLHTDSFLSNSVPLFVQGWAQRPSGGSGKVGPGGTAGAILKATKPQMLVRFGAWWFAESSDVRKQSGQRLWEAKSTEKNRKKTGKNTTRNIMGCFLILIISGKLYTIFSILRFLAKKVNSNSKTWSRWISGGAFFFFGKYGKFVWKHSLPGYVIHAKSLNSFFFGKLFKLCIHIKDGNVFFSFCEDGLFEGRCIEDVT